MPQETLMNTEEAMKYLGLSKTTGEAWRCRGGGPIFLKLGKAVRYRKSDLDDFLNSRTHTSTSKIDGRVSK